MKIPNRDFKRFKNACERLCQLMGMQHFTRVYQRCRGGNAAECSVEFDQHAIYLRLGVSVLEPQLYGGPELCALHEMCHVLTWTLSDLASDASMALVHDENIARRFENMMKALLTEKQMKELGDD